MCVFLRRKVCSNNHATIMQIFTKYNSPSSSSGARKVAQLEAEVRELEVRLKIFKRWQPDDGQYNIHLRDFKVQ